MKVKIGTRGSKLALWQTRTVSDILRKSVPNLDLEEIIVKTLGDKVTDRPLFKVGGQGLFIKEIEEALAEKRIDLAVHSLKDVPHQLADGMSLAAVSQREDPRDVLISKSGKKLKELPENSVIGTSSLRRQAQIRAMKLNFRFTDLRGNLDTRLRKLDEGEADAIILAAAGLKRLGFDARITEYFPVETMLPAAGQGFLGLECRRSDLERLKPLLDAIEDPSARAVATAERAFLKRLQGGCQVPLAVYAIIQDGKLFIRAFLSDPEGKKLIRAELSGEPHQAEQLGTDVANELLKGGARQVLDEWRASANNTRNEK